MASLLGGFELVPRHVTILIGHDGLGGRSPGVSSYSLHDPLNGLGKVVAQAIERPLAAAGRALSRATRALGGAAAKINRVLDVRIAEARRLNDAVETYVVRQETAGLAVLAIALREDTK